MTPPTLPALVLALAASSPPAGGASHRVDWHGVGLHYLDSAEGQDAGEVRQALVLIHGWASSTVAWRHQFPDLAELGRVLAVDLPGHGESDPPRGPYSMAMFADAVLAVLDDAGVEKAVLVGHSNGAPVALNVLWRHPERVLAIVTVDGPLKRMFDAKDMERMFAPYRTDAWKDYMSAMVSGMAGPELGEEDREALVEMAVTTRQEAVIGGFEAVVDPRAFRDAEIDVPLLAVLAQQPSWDASYEAWVREHAPRVDYRVWTGVGHFLHVERPGAFAQALREFLRANRLLQPQDG